MGQPAVLLRYLTSANIHTHMAVHQIAMMLRRLYGVIAVVFNVLNLYGNACIPTLFHSHARVQKRLSLRALSAEASACKFFVNASMYVLALYFATNLCRQFFITRRLFFDYHIYSPAYHATLLPLKLRTLIRAPSDVLKPLLLSLLLFNGVYFQFYCFACFRLCRRRRLFIFTRLVSSISSFLTLWPRLILSVWLLAQIKYILTYTLTYMPVHYLSVLPQIAKQNCSHHKKHQQTHTMLSLGGFVL